MAEKKVVEEAAVEKKTRAKKAADTEASEKKTAKKATAKKTAEKTEKVTKAKTAEEKKLEVTLVRGFSGKMKTQIAVAKSLGLHRIGDVSVQPDNDATRGKIAKIAHMLSVKEN